MSATQQPTFIHRLMSLLLGVVILGVGAFLVWRPLTSDQHILRVNDGPTFVVEVADEASERMQGLSGRDSLGKYEGMLFVHRQPGLYSFTMSGMRFPLDFVWIDENKTIVDITTNVPHSQGISGLQPSSLVVYVLEVNAGTVNEQAWQIGQTVEFDVT